MGYLKEVKHLPVFLSVSNYFKPQTRYDALMYK